MWKFRCLKCLKRWKFGGNITSKWYKQPLEQALCADVVIREQLDVFGKKEDANVAKFAMARWLLASYIIFTKVKSRLLLRLANPLKADCAV